MKKLFTLVLCGLLFAGCTDSAPTDPDDADKAVAYCEGVGGRVLSSIESDFARLEGDSVYPVCVFDDNRQCELQALFDGNCPIGGYRITGYETSAEIYCAVMGHEAVVGEPYCLVSGQMCDLATYFSSLGATCDIIAPTRPSDPEGTTPPDAPEGTLE